MTRFNQVLIFISGKYRHVLLGLSSLEFDFLPSVNRQSRLAGLLWLLYTIWNCYGMEG